MNKIERALQRTTDTKDLVIGPGVVSQTASMFQKLFPGATALIIADTNTWKVAGKAVLQSLESASVPHVQSFVFDDPDLYAEWKFVEQLKAYMEPLDVIAIAVGSGVINDLTKYTSHILGRKSMCVVDPVIAADAPKELAASGYADLIAKIPAGADWMLADAVGAEAIDPFGWDLVQDGLRESLSAPAAVHAGDVEMTEKLSEGLLMSGFAMQAIHSSRPASGTEHQFSHYWDMENLAYPNGKHVSHGFKVGIGTLASTASLEFLLEKDLENLDVDKCVAAWKSWDETEAEIRTIFEGKPGHLARGLEETRGKYVDKEGLRKQLEALKAAWPELREKIRAQIIPFSEVYENLKLVGAPYEPEMICVDRERMRRTFSGIPFMRSRFTNIDIVYRLGLMPELVERLFGKGGIWEVK